jgi:hypothetical protein
MVMVLMRMVMDLWLWTYGADYGDDDGTTGQVV